MTYVYKYVYKVVEWGRPAVRVLPFILAALVSVASPLTAREHPGHGTKVVLGTLKEVARDAIVVEVLDTAGGGTARVRVLLSPETPFRIDKERLTSLDGMIGQRAIVSVDWEDDDRGGQTLTATEVRFTRPKKK
ncbi:MAG: hypothetical protein AB7R67_19490 [Vicinamibacterales bacterium]